MGYSKKKKYSGNIRKKTRGKSKRNIRRRKYQRGGAPEVGDKVEFNDTYGVKQTGTVIGIEDTDLRVKLPNGLNRLVKSAEARPAATKTVAEEAERIMSLSPNHPERKAFEAKQEAAANAKERWLRAGRQVKAAVGRRAKMADNEAAMAVRAEVGTAGQTATQTDDTNYAQQLTPWEREQKYKQFASDQKDEGGNVIDMVRQKPMKPDGAQPAHLIDATHEEAVHPRGDDLEEEGATPRAPGTGVPSGLIRLDSASSRADARVDMDSMAAMADVSEADDKARREADEKARREADEKARREKIAQLVSSGVGAAARRGAQRVLDASAPMPQDQFSDQYSTGEAALAEQAGAQLAAQRAKNDAAEVAEAPIAPRSRSEDPRRDAKLRAQKDMGTLFAEAAREESAKQNQYEVKYPITPSVSVNEAVALFQRMGLKEFEEAIKNPNAPNAAAAAQTSKNETAELLKESNDFLKQLKSGTFRTAVDVAAELGRAPGVRPQPARRVLLPARDEDDSLVLDAANVLGSQQRAPWDVARARLQHADGFAPPEPEAGASGPQAATQRRAELGRAPEARRAQIEEGRRFPEVEEGRVEEREAGFWATNAEDAAAAQHETEEAAVAAARREAQEAAEAAAKEKARLEAAAPNLQLGAPAKALLPPPPVIGAAEQTDARREDARAAAEAAAKEKARIEAEASAAARREAQEAAEAAAARDAREAARVRLRELAAGPQNIPEWTLAKAAARQAGMDKEELATETAGVEPHWEAQKAEAQKAEAAAKAAAARADAERADAEKKAKVAPAAGNWLASVAEDEARLQERINAEQREYLEEAPPPPRGAMLLATAGSPVRGTRGAALSEAGNAARLRAEATRMAEADQELTAPLAPSAPAQGSAAANMQNFLNNLSTEAPTDAEMRDARGVKSARLLDAHHKRQAEQQAERDKRGTERREARAVRERPRMSTGASSSTLLGHGEWPARNEPDLVPLPGTVAHFGGGGKRKSRNKRNKRAKRQTGGRGKGRKQYGGAIDLDYSIQMKDDAHTIINNTYEDVHRAYDGADQRRIRQLIDRMRDEYVIPLNPTMNHLNRLSELAQQNIASKLRSLSKLLDDIMVEFAKASRIVQYLASITLKIIRDLETKVSKLKGVVKFLFMRDGGAGTIIDGQAADGELVVNLLTQIIRIIKNLESTRREFVKEAWVRLDILNRLLAKLQSLNDKGDGGLDEMKNLVVTMITRARKATAAASLADIQEKHASKIANQFVRDVEAKKFDKLPRAEKGRMFDILFGSLEAYLQAAAATDGVGGISKFTADDVDLQRRLQLAHTDKINADAGNEFPTSQARAADYYIGGGGRTRPRRHVRRKHTRINKKKKNTHKRIYKNKRKTVKRRLHKKTRRTKLLKKGTKKALKKGTKKRH